jgi:GntP family gluconate:H+ symporter
MAGTLNLDPGLTILFGLCSGVVPVGAGWLVSHWINRRVEIPLAQLESGDAPGAAGPPGHEPVDVTLRREEDLPSLAASLTPVLLPVVLISMASFLGAFAGGISRGLGHVGFRWFPQAYEVVSFIGNRNVALLIGTVVAVAVLMRQRGVGLAKVGDLIGPPLETAGVIILITSAGGAFGAMLRNAGVGEAIKSAASGVNISLLVLAWVVALVIRIAQGSATVAMLTTAAMIYPIMTSSAGAGQLPYHPVYVFLAIGYGAFGCSWMNDSGFWVVSRLGGLTERQTLKTWTVLLSCMSVVGLLTTLALSRLLPMR